MIDCKVKNWEGEAVSQASIELKVATDDNASHIVHRALVRHRANARQGNASTKTRSEVRGGGRKPWRQKGTGRARAGSIRSPLWRGGGVIFGPKPRDYSKKMNRKERRLAIRTAFDSRKTDLVAVDLEDITQNLPQPKTKELASALTRWGIDTDKQVLFILSKISETLYLSARNIAGVRLIRADSLNVYDLLLADTIVVTVDALTKIEEVYGD